MAGLLCVWATLPEESLDWYEDEYIPERRAKLADHALHCERTTSGFEGDAPGQVDAPSPHFTVYEVKDVQAAAASYYDKSNHPSEELKAGPLKDARFDTRTFRELQKWQSKDWSGDASHIASVSAVEMRVSKEFKDNVLEYFTTVMIPYIMKSPDVHRFRLFEVDNATVLEGASHETKENDDTLPYLSLVEFATEDYPWDVILEMADTDEWKRWVGDPKMMTWQVGHYLVNKLYSEKHPGGIIPQSTNNSDAASGED